MTELLHSGRTDLETIVFERRSIREYKNQPVPREVLEEVLRIAQRAPSSMNTQPWHFHVFTGEPLGASARATPRRWCPGQRWIARSR